MTDEFRVVCTGGRSYGDVPECQSAEHLRLAKLKAERERKHLFAAMDAIHAKRPITSLMVGSKTGADRWFYVWADTAHVPALREMADWTKHGKAAGPIRNGEMLSKQAPHAVICASGGDGTADCVRKARWLDIEVIEIGPPPE